MTREQSKALEPGERVCWNRNGADIGTVKTVTWTEVTIAWDKGDRTTHHHNDMAQITLEGAAATTADSPCA